MEPAPLDAPRALLWTLLAIAGLVLGSSALAALRPGGVDVVSLGAVEAVIFLLLAYLVLQRHQPDRSLRDALGLRPTHPALLALGLGLGVAAQAPATGIQALVEGLSPTPEGELLRRAELLRVDSPGRVLGLVLGAVLLVPLVEELFFRGALFGALRRSASPLSAAGVTSVGFTLTHLDWRSWAPLLPVALLLGHLRAVSGSLLPCVGLHVGFNAVTVSSLALGFGSARSGPSLPPWALLAGGVTTLLLAAGAHLVGMQSERARGAREEDAP